MHPAGVLYKVIRRLVYMAEAEEPGTFKQLVAPLPPHPIAKCKADISVLVTLVIDKYLYHLPVYRQQQRFKQYGTDIKYNTLSNWLNRIPDVLEPLYEVLLRELIIGGYLMMDETTYRVLDNEKQKGKKSHMGYLWALANPLQSIVAFNYERGRSKKDVDHILSSYKGYLQTNAYAAYTKYGQQRGLFTFFACRMHEGIFRKPGPVISKDSIMRWKTSLHPCTLLKSAGSKGLLLGAGLLTCAYPLLTGMTIIRCFFMPLTGFVSGRN